MTGVMHALLMLRLVNRSRAGLICLEDAGKDSMVKFVCALFMLRMLSKLDEVRADLDCLEDVDKEGALDEGRLPTQHSLEGLHVCTTRHAQSENRHFVGVQTSKQKRLCN